MCNFYTCTPPILGIFAIADHPDLPDDCNNVKLEEVNSVVKYI